MRLAAAALVIGLGWWGLRAVSDATRPQPDLVAVFALHVNAAHTPPEAKASIDQINSLLTEFSNMYQTSFAYLSSETDKKTVLSILHALLNEAMSFMHDVYVMSRGSRHIQAGMQAVKSLGESLLRESSMRLDVPGFYPSPLGHGPMPWVPGADSTDF